MLESAFKETILTPKLADSSKTLMQWQEQPSRFKHYPKFLFRYQLDPANELDRFILNIRSITDTSFIGDKPYPKLNVPSAGNLHPIEVYLQIRKVPGKLSGIYHLDTKNNTLILIKEIEGDGIEYFYDYTNRQEGIFIFFTSVYFRSSWKYGLRAWRYLLLDMGHQIGALLAATSIYQKKLTFLESSQHDQVESFLGLMPGEKLLCSATISQPLKRKVTKPLQNCMQVQPTDYFVPNPELQDLHNHFTPYYIDQEKQKKFQSLNTKTLQSLIHSRRSARIFTANALSEPTLERILHKCFEVDDSFLCSVCIMQSYNTTLGIYQKGSLLKKGSFVHEISNLLLSQTIAYTGAIILFISVSKMTSYTFYNAGIFSHELYLLCEELNIGCSGVGAYYDDQCKAFLETEQDIIYCISIGELEGK